MTKKSVALEVQTAPSLTRGAQVCLASVLLRERRPREKHGHLHLCHPQQSPSDSWLTALSLVHVGAEGTTDHWICDQPVPRLPPSRALMT